MRTKTLFFILIIGLLGSSCMTNKKVVLFQGKKNRDYKLDFPKFTIRTNDFLYIQIGAVDADLGSLISNAETSGGGGNQQIQPQSLYFTSYHVSDSGTVDLPVVGHLKVTDLSIQEAEGLINAEFAKYFKNIQVSVRYPGISFSVIGEVRAPGLKTVFQEQVNLMEALALAGDMDLFADREEVIIYRRYEDRMVSRKVNLLDDNIISKPEFFLQPGDVIYVQPLQRKHVGLGTTGVAAFQTMVSILSSVVLIVNLTQ